MYPKSQLYYYPPLFIIIILLSFFSCCFSSYHVYYNHPYINHGSDYPNLRKPGQEILRRARLPRHPTPPPKIFNVDEFGAKADGTDDSEAFIRAWKEACSSNGNAVMVVPQNRVYHLKPITFPGPCKSRLTMKISGTIRATVRLSDYEEDRRHWLVFDNVNNFKVDGDGVINGNGKVWWKNSCKINKSLPCIGAPTGVTFYGCKNLKVANLMFKNPQQMHISFQNCVNVIVVNIKIIAPGNSPNTDGIHVTGTENIHIKNSVIRTGDDCISIVSGSKNVWATDITCGPGHGISIGSLGEGNSEALVSNVMVNRVMFSGTTNGVRIKTWQGGSGYAKNIIFQNVVMHNVSNPIIIDQNYCDQQEPCQEQESAVQVTGIVYKNIKGTSATKVAVKFDCSKRYNCEGILMQDVILSRHEDDGIAEASCLNVRLNNRGKISPLCN